MSWDTEKVDFGKTADDYARHRTGFPGSVYERLAGRGVGLEGQRVLDLGTGTGAVARALARRGCRVTGLDPSEALTAQARRLDAEAGVAIDYVTARAEQTGLPDAAFEVVTAGQCWHWFEAARVAAEIRRLLVPGGAAVILAYDWLPLPGNVVAATEEVVLRHNPEWPWAGGRGVYGDRLTDLGVAGFERIESFSYDEPAAYSHEDWRGRMRASAPIAASLAPEAVAAFDADLAAALKDRFPDEPLSVPHRAFVVIGRKPAEEGA